MQPRPGQELTGHPRRWAILGVLVVSLLVVVLDNTVLNVAMRTIADPVHGLGASQAELEWAINSYTLVFAGLLFTRRRLGDRIGRRRMLMIGLVLFGLASLASAYAQTPTQLIWARALHGHRRGGRHAVDAVDHLQRLRPPRAGQGHRRLGRRGRPRAWPSARWSAALLLEHFWWGSVFLINVPIIVLGSGRRACPGAGVARPQAGSTSTWSASCCPSSAWSLLVYGIIDGGEHGFGRVQVVGVDPGRPGGPGGVRLVRATYRPSVAGRQAVPRRRGSRPRSARIGLVFFAAMGTLFFLAFYLQLVRGYSPLQAGLLMTPFAAAQLIFAPLSAGDGPAVRAQGGLRGRAVAGQPDDGRLRRRRHPDADLGACSR